MDGIDGVDDDDEDIERSPGEEEDEGDKGEEEVGSLAPVLLTDGGGGRGLRDVPTEPALGLAEGEVDPEVGHGDQQAGQEELDTQAEHRVHLPPEHRREALIAVGGVLEENLNFGETEEGIGEEDTEDETEE